ncbi:MAG: TerC family protein [Planctomycetaceae bacterium]|nr:TerC family protein [Planctomycetaceae bacterium]
MSPLLVFLASIAQIVLINVVLSGDNALVIALAARQLPPDQRRKAMIWGSATAIALRLVLTLIVSYVLLVPGLRFAGAILLAWIACKLIQEENPATGHEGTASSTLRTAVLRIALADLIMSLDNVVAIAGVGQADPVALTIGLVLSIAMILICSNAILTLMNRFRWLAFVGAAVLALTAAGMMEHDLEFAKMLGHARDPDRWPFWADWTFRGTVMSGCLTSSRWWPKRNPMAPL